MRLTQVLDMQTYFTNFPEKRPVRNGSYEQQCGDNLYFRDGDRWARLPSAEHNTEQDFAKDRGRPVFLADGTENYWYFGAGSKLCKLDGFTDRFPWLLKDRQGFSYIYDERRIAAFATWLDEFGQRGLIGQPRDRAYTSADRYLVGIDPSPCWLPRDCDTRQREVGAVGRSERLTPSLDSRRGCGANEPGLPMRRRGTCSGA
jgi:hypothetical protein